MPHASRRPVLLEICVDTPRGLDAAFAAGADRIELCAALALGGLTPGAGLIARAARAPVPVYAMIRPRAGDFVFTRADADAMLVEIDAVRRAGLAGVVLGASRPDMTLDETLLAELLGAAEGLGATLHRAFDLTPDKDEALETAVSLGFERILTSGGAPGAEAGLERLAALVERAAGRLSIMPGGGVRAQNVPSIVGRTGVHEIHASARRPVALPALLVELGFAPRDHFETDAGEIARLKAAARAAGAA